MTLQKAMRVRAELKKEAAKLTEILDRADFQLTWETTKPTEEEIQAKRNEKLYALNGMTFAEAAQKLFEINEECMKLNVAIEDANAQGHKLLYKEACIKSKLGFINICLNKERKIEAHTSRYATNTIGHIIGADSNNPVKVDCYNYPIVDENCFGKSLMELKKQFSKELEIVRDEISAFNASAKVDYEMPENLL